MKTIIFISNKYTRGIKTEICNVKISICNKSFLNSLFSDHVEDCRLSASKLLVAWRGCAMFNRLSCLIWRVFIYVCSGYDSQPSLQWSFATDTLVYPITLSSVILHEGNITFHVGTDIRTHTTSERAVTFLPLYVN